MTLKPPTLSASEAGLIAFRNAVKLYESSLTHKAFRELHRKELARWQKLYATLADKRSVGSAANVHFLTVSALCGELLAEYGPEAPPKKRPAKVVVRQPLTYPDFPDAASLRMHFLASTGLRLDRALALASYAPFVSSQTSPKGRILISVGLESSDERLFARLVDQVDNSLARDLTQTGFNIGYGERPEGVLPGEPWMSAPLDPKQPLARIWSDNEKAESYSAWASAMNPPYSRGGQSVGQVLPSIDRTSPFDPDPRWQQMLELTAGNDVQGAAALLNTIPGQDREIHFDEALYLRFLTDGKVRADDIRYVARKYVMNSLIAGRLIDEFDDFLALVDTAFQTNQPALNEITCLREDFGSYANPPWSSAANWPSFREEWAFRRHLGRLFSIHPAIQVSDCERAFASHFLDAENSFRRTRSIPEVGRGWGSEVALFDLIRSIWPSAIHQWRPPFLGLQSIDVYVPELKLAVEYQGQQHFEPVKLFGGLEGLERTKKRDERKAELLRAHEIQLLMWRYDAPITRMALIQRIQQLRLPIPPDSPSALDRG